MSLDDCNVPPLPSQVPEKLLATFGRRSLAVESEREMKHSNMKHSNIAVFQNAVFHSTAAKDSQAHSCQAQPAKLSEPPSRQSAEPSTALSPVLKGTETGCYFNSPAN